MNLPPKVARPIYRSPLRQWLDREYFIFKRHCQTTSASACGWTTPICTASCAVAANWRKTNRVEERNHRIVQQSWGCYTRHNRIIRVTTRADGSEEETILAVNHAVMMYAPLLPQDGRNLID